MFNIYNIYFLYIMIKSIIKVEEDIYIPFFCSENGVYIDKSPYKPYQKNCIRYECRCKAGAYFESNAQFKQHIKTKTHCDFISNYCKYYKEVDESQKTIKQLRVENELLTRKNRQLTKLCIDTKKEKTELEEVNKNLKKKVKYIKKNYNSDNVIVNIEEHEKLKNDYTILKNKYNEYKYIIEDLDNVQNILI